MDMTPTLAPKSDQLNADDLITGPRVVVITKVTAGNANQPVAVHFDGDEGRPFYPCKSMRRVMVAAWGADAANYPGRAMELFRDPEVMYGGIKVGGIRISRLSHIPRALEIALTVTRAKRAMYQVQPLSVPAVNEAPGELSRPELIEKVWERLSEEGVTVEGVEALVVKAGGTTGLGSLDDVVLKQLLTAKITPEKVQAWNGTAA